MSLTEADQLFVGLHEDGANDLLQAIFTARPRLLNYASQPFASATTVSITQMAPIAFPGVAGGLGWAVGFSIPRLDFFPQTAALPPELPALSANHLSLSTRVTLIVNCAECRDMDQHDLKDEERERLGRGEEVDERRDNWRDERDDEPSKHGHRIPRCESRPIRASLEVHAVARPTVNYFGPGSGEIMFRLEAIEIVDIAPGGLESVVECLLRMILQAVLDTVRLPFQAISAGAFTLALTRGPEIADDQLKVWGTV